MAYTFLKMYQVYQTLCDKAETPYFPEDQFDEIANIKYNDFVTEECRKVEVNQEHTVRIHGLYEKFAKVNSSVISIKNDIPNFRYMLRFTSKYKKDCNGAVSFPEVPIRKAPNNNVDQIQRDPFGRGIDDDPCYVPDKDASGPTYKVLSDTTPLELSITYVRKPQVINSNGAPATLFELDDYIADAIIRAAAYRTDVIIENLPRAQAEAAEQNELKQQ